MDRIYLGIIGRKRIPDEENDLRMVVAWKSIR